VPSLRDVQEETPQSTVFVALPDTWQAMHLRELGGASEPKPKDEGDDADAVPTSIPSPPIFTPLRFRPVSMELRSPAKPQMPRSRSAEAIGRQAPTPSDLNDDSDLGEMDEGERARLQADLPSRSGSRIAHIFQRRLVSHETRERAIAHTHRSERRQGWSGEWNAANVQDVIAKLRELK
jgi:hypothetical protein